MLKSPCGKVYIGQSTDLERRKRAFFNGNKSFPKNYRSLVGAVREYPKSQWEYILLCTCPKSVLDVCERFYISHFDSMNPQKGYNNESGGNLGKTASISAKQKMSTSSTGKKHSEETKRKITEWLVGKCGDDSRAAKAVLQYEKDGTFVKRYASILEAAASVGVHFSAISNCLRGKTKSSAGFLWAFEN